MGDFMENFMKDKEFTATFKIDPGNVRIEPNVHVEPDVPAGPNPEGEDEMLFGYPQDEEENEYRYIEPRWLDALAEGLTAGAKRHPGETWRSIPAEEHAARALRHLNLYRAGDRSEPHLINASMRCMMAFALSDPEIDLTSLLKG